jgi:HEAT repeat protein
MPLAWIAKGLRMGYWRHASAVHRSNDKNLPLLISDPVYSVRTGKKTWWLVAFILAGIVLAAGLVYFETQRGPSFEGKPVSYWFKEYCQSHGDTDDTNHQAETDLAFQEMGTNALPYLVRQDLHTGTYTAWRTDVYHLLGKLPDAWDVPDFFGLEDKSESASELINHLQPPYGLVLPLIKPALDSTNATLHYRALDILFSCGGDTNDLPLILRCFARALHYRDRESRHLALLAFAGSNNRALTKAEVPDLLDILNDNKGPDGLYVEAASALGSIGTNAAAAVPPLQSLFKHETNWFARAKLAGALCSIDANQKDALGFLIDGLKDESLPGTNGSRALSAMGFSPYPERHSHAWNAASELSTVGPNARPAAPALIDALNSTNYEVWSEAGLALNSIGMSKETFLPKLEEKLAPEHDPQKLYVFAHGILRIDPTDHEAHLALMKLIERRTVADTNAIELLRRIGPDAREAVPVLQEVLQSDDKGLREAAAAALRHIQAKDTVK